MPRRRMVVGLVGGCCRGKREAVKVEVGKMLLLLKLACVSLADKMLL